MRLNDPPSKKRHLTVHIPFYRKVAFSLKKLMTVVNLAAQKMLMILAKALKRKQIQKVYRLVDYFL